MAKRPGGEERLLEPVRGGTQIVEKGELLEHALQSWHKDAVGLRQVRHVSSQAGPCHGNLVSPS